MKEARVKGRRRIFIPFEPTIKMIIYDPYHADYNKKYFKEKSK